MCSHFYNGIWSHLATHKASGRLENEAESKWKDLNQAADFMTVCHVGQCWAHCPPNVCLMSSLQGHINVQSIQ